MRQTAQAQHDLGLACEFGVEPGSFKSLGLRLWKQPAAHALSVDTGLTVAIDSLHQAKANDEDHNDQPGHPLIVSLLSLPGYAPGVQVGG